MGNRIDFVDVLEVARDRNRRIGLGGRRDRGETSGIDGLLGDDRETGCSGNFLEPIRLS